MNVCLHSRRFSHGDSPVRVNRSDWSWGVER